MVKRGKREEGYLQEEKAVQYLKQNGYRILQRNFYSRYGEIDIIARDKEYLVFIEVKYRKSERGGHPVEAVDVRKQERICKTAQWFLKRYGYNQETPCRFDVVAILGDDVNLLRNAFEYQC